MCLFKLHILSYWFLIPIVCSWPRRDLQQRALHDCMHWVQSDGIFPWLTFYLRVVYVFMTVPVTKLLSNLYYGFGWSTGHRLQHSAVCSTYISEFPIMLQCVPGPGNDMQSAECRGDTGGQSPLHLPAPFPVWFHHPWDLKQMVLRRPHTSYKQKLNHI